MKVVHIAYLFILQILFQVRHVSCASEHTYLTRDDSFDRIDIAEVRCNNTAVAVVNDFPFKYFVIGFRVNVSEDQIEKGTIFSAITNNLDQECGSMSLDVHQNGHSFEFTVINEDCVEHTAVYFPPEGDVRGIIYDIRIEYSNYNWFTLSIDGEALYEENTLIGFGTHNVSVCSAPMAGGAPSSSLQGLAGIMTELYIFKLIGPEVEDYHDIKLFEFYLVTISCCILGLCVVSACCFFYYEWIMRSWLKKHAPCIYQCTQKFGCPMDPSDSHKIENMPRAGGASAGKDAALTADAPLDIEQQIQLTNAHTTVVELIQVKPPAAE